LRRFLHGDHAEAFPEEGAGAWAAMREVRGGGGDGDDRGEEDGGEEGGEERGVLRVRGDEGALKVNATKPIKPITPRVPEAFTYHNYLPFTDDRGTDWIYAYGAPSNMSEYVQTEHLYH
jgi:hypothetical protein